MKKFWKKLLTVVVVTLFILGCGYIIYQVVEHAKIKFPNETILCGY